MIWLTWRQHRLQLLFGTAVLALLLTFLVVSGLGIASTFRGSGLAHCLAVPGRDCNDLSNNFTTRYSNLQFLIPLFLVLPALLGIFWGAPLVAREVEHGTHRLAWTQGVTRLRWIGVKVAALSGATVAGAAVISWADSWWSRPLVTASDARFGLGVFDLRGVVPIAYALFALALGVAAGTIIGRTVPAMGVTIAAFAAVRAGVALWLRQHYLPMKTIAFSVLRDNPRVGHGDWVVSSSTVDAVGRFLGIGRTINFNVLAPRCPELIPQKGSFPSQQALEACINRLGIHVVARYQPGNRYWLFQGIETAIFATLAIALLLFSAWWVMRRVT